MNIAGPLSADDAFSPAMKKRNVKIIFLVALLLSIALHAAAYYSVSYCLFGLHRRIGPATKEGKADFLEIGLVSVPLHPPVAPAPDREAKRDEVETLVPLSEIEPARESPETEAELRSLPLPVGRAGEAAFSSGPAFSEYINAVRRKIEGEVSYPRRARLRRLEGTVRLGFRIGRDGDLLSVRLIEPSPHADLNQAALADLRRAAPFPGPEESLEDKEIAVSIEYKSAY